MFKVEIFFHNTMSSMLNDTNMIEIEVDGEGQLTALMIDTKNNGYHDEENCVFYPPWELRELRYTEVA